MVQGINSNAFFPDPVRHSLQCGEIQPIEKQINELFHSVNKIFNTFILQKFENKSYSHKDKLLIHYNDIINTTSQ